MSEIQVAPVTAGSDAVSEIRLMYATLLSDTPVLDATQVTNPWVYGSVTFSGGFSDNLGWIRSAFWYWVEAEDAAGRVSRSAPFFGGAAADRECSVSGVLDASRDGDPVTASVVGIIEVGGVEYMGALAPGIIGPSGTWTVNCPRGATVAFSFPSGNGTEVVIPSTATAVFGDLL